MDSYKADTAPPIKHQVLRFAIVPVLAEKRQCHAPMGSALNKDGGRLRLAYNSRCHEDIIVETEVILLSAGRLPEEPAGWGRGSG